MDHIRQVSLRGASANDSTALAALFTQSRQASMPYLPNLYTQSQVHWWISNIVLKQTNVTVAVFENHELAGFSSVQGESLEHLYISPKAQGIGIGTLLLEAAKSAANQLHLHVFQRNAPARAFYENTTFA
jgi:GNAT superfamily N-acetyltransferase